MQKNSYQWFLDEGLKEVFHDIGTIEDYTGNLALSFVDFRLDKEPKYSIKECKERDVTYAAPLRVTARLLNKETGEVKDQEIFMGDFPLMTDAGTFVINGAEPVSYTHLDVYKRQTLINNERAQAGLAPVTLGDSNHNAAAMERAEELAVSYSYVCLLYTSRCV